MKNSFIILLSIVCFSALAQTRQNINKNTGTVSNVLTTIDSIRFNGSSTTMEVVLQNGTLESHSISDIQNVKFISSSQHSCGADSVHNPNLNYGSMTDQEGNVYKTIIIGTQEWMAENLKTSIYRNGDIIATNLTDAEWSNTVNTQLGAWVNYNNDSQYDCPYGKLYSWYTVADPRNLCPTGWHVPTDNEWTTLTDYLGGIDIAGGKMKTAGLEFWYSPNVGAINESGFSGLPSGKRTYDGAFNTIGGIGNWWSSSDFDLVYSEASSRYLLYNSGIAGRSVIAYKLYGNSVRCLKDLINTGSTLPIISTNSIAIVNSEGTSAVGIGFITSDGGATVIQRGLCWSTSSEPTISDNRTLDGSGIGSYSSNVLTDGSFTSNLVGLASNTTYYVRAYAVNSVGIAYGNQLILPALNPSQNSCGTYNIHNPILNYGSMTDQEGNDYKTIVIGTQKWMAENLKTSIYRNGDSIATNLTDVEWANTINSQIGAFAFYDNDSLYECPNGNLYNWYAVADPRNLCPTGWHVPTDNEWTTLTDYLGGFSVAGNKMKTTGLSYWISNNALATNSSGFSGLLGGYRNYSGSFDNYNDDGCWWSSSSDASYISNSLYLRLNSNYSNADYNSDNKGAGFSVRCLSDIINTVSILPSVITSTNVILNSTENSAVSGGNITSDGGAPVTQRGICWSTSPNPTTSSNTTFDGNGIGSFTSNMTGLSANITYYVRAYAINSVGTAYGNQQIFTTLIASPHSCGANNVHNPNLNYGSMTDQEGNVHKTIVIGTQEWMAENLKTSIYRNGDPIATNLTDVEWGNTSNTNLGAWVYYNNDSQYDCPYGKLYNWYALADPRHVCPSGWHEPTDSEWTSLTDYLGGVAIAGGKMKTTGIQYWDSLNTNATNESGFSGLPGGYYNVSSSLIGTYNYFWSASERNNNTSWYRFLRFNGENIYPYYIQKTQGMSVRCLKD